MPRTNETVDGIRFINKSDTVPIKKTILVFGAGRGGTSAISGCLRELGVKMPKAHPLKHEWSPITDDGPFNAFKFEQIVAQLNIDHPVWGWKSPKDLFRTAEILPRLRSPYIVAIVRNPLDISLSIENYEKLPIEMGFSLTAAVYSHLSEFCFSTTYPVALVSYEKLLSNGGLIVEALNDWLQLTDREEVISQAVEFVSGTPRYKKNSSNIDDLSFSKEEIVQDQQNSWVSQYPKSIGLLAQSCAMLERDLTGAIQQIWHLRDLLYASCRDRAADIGLNLDQSLLYEMHSIDYVEFCRVFAIGEVSSDSTRLNDSIQIASSTSNGLTSNAENTHLLPEAYQNLRRRLMDVSKQRRDLQETMEDISRKKEAILRATKSLRTDDSAIALPCSARAASDQVGS